MTSLRTAALFPVLGVLTSLASPLRAAPDNTLGMAIMSASAYGSNVMQSSGVQTIVNPSTGRYEITFDRSVTDCAHVASATNAYPEADFGAAWGVKVRHHSSSPDLLAVYTFGTDGTTLATRPFSLIVFCPK